MKVWMLLLLFTLTACASGNVVLETGDAMTDCCSVTIGGEIRTCAAPGTRSCDSCDEFCESIGRASSSD